MIDSLIPIRLKEINAITSERKLKIQQYIVPDIAIKMKKEEHRRRNKNDPMLSIIYPENGIAISDTNVIIIVYIFDIYILILNTNKYM